MKFFRKNTKYLLAVFMALLLVVWLLEDTIQSLGRGGGPDVEWGQAYGETVSVDEIVSTNGVAEILTGLGLPWESLAGRMRKPLNVKEWYMLDAEARRRNIYVPDSDVAKMRETFPPEAIQSVRNRRKVTNDEIDNALRSLLRVQKAFFTDLDAIKVSEADIQHYVRNTAEKAKVKLAILDASQFVDSTWEPTEEQYQEHFEKYRDKDPGAGEDSFGYRKPEEAQIEYIQIKVEELARQQKVDDEYAHNYWKENKEKFTKPRPPTTQPSTAPAEPYATYTEARDAVRKEIANQRARAAALRIGTDLAKALSAPWTTQPATAPSNFYRQPPEDALDLQRYPRMMDAFREKAPGALAYQRTQMMTRQGMYTLGPVASAMALQGSPDAVALAHAAFLVQGLEASPKGSAFERQARWFHNLYETLPEPFVDQAGNVYVFRTLAVLPKRPPASLTEVKDKIREDLRLQRAAEEARKQAEQLVDRAKQVGIDEAVQENAALASKLGQPPVKTPKPFARREAVYGQMMPTQVQEIDDEPTGEFVKTVFDLAEKTTTQPQKVALYPMETRRRWVVVQLVDILLVTKAEYEQERRMAEIMLRQQRQMEFAASWFSPENIRARVNWKPAYPEEEQAAAEQAEM